MNILNENEMREGRTSFGDRDMQTGSKKLLNLIAIAMLVD
jgi:hypothetical protein